MSSNGGRAWQALLALLRSQKPHMVAISAPFDLTPQLAHAIHAIPDDGVTMRALAAELACDASNATGIADRLERRGLIERTSDPDDRRLKRRLPDRRGPAHPGGDRGPPGGGSAADRRAQRGRPANVARDPRAGPGARRSRAAALERLTGLSPRPRRAEERTERSSPMPDPIAPAPAQQAAPPPPAPPAPPPRSRPPRAIPTARTTPSCAAARAPRSRPGQSLWNDGNLRAEYERRVGAVGSGPDASAARKAIRVDIRERSSPFARGLAEHIGNSAKRTASLAPKTPEELAASAARSNAAVNALGEGFRYGGKALVGVGAAVSIYDIATAPPGQRVEQATKEAGSWAGALAVGTAGAEGGAALGTMIAPGIGTAIGGAVGGLAGGVVERSAARRPSSRSGTTSPGTSPPRGHRHVSLVKTPARPKPDPLTGVLIEAARSCGPAGPVQAAVLGQGPDVQPLLEAYEGRRWAEASRFRDFDPARDNLVLYVLRCGGVAGSRSRPCWTRSNPTTRPGWARPATCLLGEERAALAELALGGWKPLAGWTPRRPLRPGSSPPAPRPRRRRGPRRSSPARRHARAAHRARRVRARAARPGRRSWPAARHGASRRSL